MACCLPLLSGILPPSLGDKLVVDVRGGGQDEDAPPRVMTSIFDFLGVGQKSTDKEAFEDQDSYEKFYRIWYKKGLLCFKPKSLGGSGSAALVRRLDEPQSKDLQAENSSVAEADKSLIKTGYDWSKQSSVESQSQTEGRSLRNYWEERSHTSPPKPETAPKSMPVEQ